MALTKQQAFKESKELLGMVPSWMEEMPAAVAGPFWEMFRDFQLSETLIPNKYKDLIGLAVAGATRCRYCAMFHTEGARFNGATDEEIAEASAMGGLTMMASTYINAQQIDYDKFAKETRQIIDYVKKHPPKPARAVA